MTIALYPGRFDPITYGHLDIATRAAQVFDELVIGVFATPQKNLLFSTEERVDMAQRAVTHISNIRVEPFFGLTVDFAKQLNAAVIVRGLRMGSDFEREFEMALMNKKLAPEIEVLCMMTSVQYQFLSSSILKEVAQLGGCIDDLVPEYVANTLREKLSVVATKI
ncbi:MAG: Phosphopantetheine adenylyltransferase [Chloroflexi bacterium]|nr:Phosphopantetheine adenylyltransferase [Chloroflexota bacterium]MBT9165982.1 Phosphopantetheine adenylyltransferase [Chloroflexota bacterium]